ncbi:uncharacterized protein LOC134564854 isoform X1 [Prinia subflava]|uniref:uncharacterized protein LOC134564854 isoform X1 n=1 Tax=Prinia subflava TaxID=208062 RepID=UPI002FE112CA
MKAMKLENNKCLACVQNKHCMEHAVLSEILGGKRDELESELLVSPMAPGTTTAPSTPSSTPLTLTPPDSLTPPSLAPAQYVSPPPLSAEGNYPPLPVPAAPPLAPPPSAQVPAPPPPAQRTPPSPHTPAQSYPAPPPTPAERKYTDLQVDSEQRRTQLAFIFLSQAQEDIRKKLQKLEREELRNLDKLLEVAWKVYNNRDREIIKKQGQSLLAVLQRQGRGRSRGGRGVNRGGFGRGSGHGRLGLNQCAYCRIEGHWKRECPNRFSQNSQPQLDSMFNQSHEHQLDSVARVMVLHEREPGSREPMVTLHLEGKDVDFLIDTGATHSVLNYLEGQIGNKSAAVIGATGKEEVRPFLQPLELSFEDKILTHEFLYMPDCPTPLLGRDLLAALEAVITFENGELVMKIPESKTGKILMIKEKPISNIPKEVEDAVIPSVWETDVPGKSKLAQPVHVELKEGAKAVRIKQYPIKPEARQGIAKTIDKFLKYQILEECKSEYNTPIFPVKKPNGEYRLVQDLRGINEITKDIHPVVANPYTLLSSVKEIYKWFTVIDLKDAFFCIPLDQESRKLFAFE